jgi:tyrosyl-tRNA synthetase
MSTPSPNLFEELTWRGFINQITDPELPALLAGQSIRLYCGFDPTADSLHIGSLLPIMGLAHFQRAGHRPIALVGGGTGLIGDPSFKAQERSMLTKELVQTNAGGIHRQLAHFMRFDGENAAVMINNADWLCELPLVDFLRDIGKHFSVNAMLARDSVKNRLQDRDQGISFTEFSYSLLQAYDFLHLNDSHDCLMQVGGSDQWGNIVSGIDLIRRLRDKQAYGITFPLVTSSYKFYQFWINQSDMDAGQYLRFFTFLSREEIEDLDRQTREEPHKRAAQRRLAEEVTRLVHGGEALQNAQRASQAVFGGELTGLDERTLLEVFSEVPSADLPVGDLAAERPLLDALVEAGVFPSKGEARRLVRNGGLYVNNARIDAEDAKLGKGSLLTANLAVVRTGKKNYHLLRFV